MEIERLGSKKSVECPLEKPKFAASLLRVADLATLMQLTVWSFSKELAVQNYHDDEFISGALKKLPAVCSKNDLKVFGGEKTISFAKIDALQLRSCLDKLKDKEKQLNVLSACYESSAPLEGEDIEELEM